MKMISRRYAKVEWRSSGDFYLIDQSTNGVYLFTREQEKRFIHWDEVQLIGCGTFCLSGDHFHDLAEAVHYNEHC